MGASSTSGVGLGAAITPTNTQLSRSVHVNSLPADSTGYLYNPGNGELSWGTPSDLGDITVHEIVARDFEFEADYEKWDDLRLPGTNLRGGVSAPAFTLFRNGIYLPGFAPNQTDEVHFTVQLPHAWKEGSMLLPHVHWTHNVAEPSNDQGVIWKLEYTWANIHSTFEATSTIEGAATWTTSPPAQYYHNITGMTDLDGTGHVLSSQIIGRLYRDVTDERDTFDDLALLIELDFHYKIDGFGSDEEYVKT